MSQSEQRSNLLGRATAAVNPRHQADIDAVAAYDTAAQEIENPVATPQVEPTHNWEKRYKDLQSFNSRKINELNTTIGSLQQQGVQPVTVPKTPEEMAALKAQDPAGYARIEAIASSMLEGQMQTYNQNLATITSDLTDTRIANAEAQIRVDHPDFDSIINGEGFHVWAADQPQDIQDWIYNNPDQPQLASRALTLFKAAGDWGTTTQTPHAPLAGGDMDVGVRTNTQTPDSVDRNHPTYIWKESEIARMRPEEFGSWVEHITLAQQEGRVAIGH